MKICWDNLEGFHLTKNGFLRKGSHSYIEMDVCKECGGSYLMLRFQKTEYCSASCSQRHKKVSLVTRKKLSIAGIGRKKSKEECRAISIRMSKGGVVARNLPLYDTYAKQLIPIEETRHFARDEKLLEVKCTLRNKWFIPKRTECERRSKFLKGNSNRESRFYCSDECKMSCSVFHKEKYPRGFNPRKSRNSVITEAQLRIWREEVLKRANMFVNIVEKRPL